MSFYRKYELQRLIADGEAKTFRAIESATGRIVFLHLFNAGGMALLASLKAKLVAASGKPVPPLLEIGAFAGSQYAVTESSEPFSSLREWVDRQPEALHAASPAPPGPPPTKPAPRPPTPPAASQPPGLLDEEPGEFTRLFPSSAPLEKPALCARPPVAADPRGLLDDEPGEFTRQFPSSEPLEKPALCARPPVAADPPGLLDDEPGEFTRQFPSSEPLEKPALCARPPVANDPPGLLDDAAGEFHQMLPPSRPSGTTPATSAEEEIGDFTRAFGAVPPKAVERAKPPARLPPKPPGPPPAPPRRDVPAPPRREVPPPPSPSVEWASSALAGRADDTGEFTKLFGSGLSGQAIDIAGEQAKAARTTVNENRPFQKAGEFTRIFGPEMGGEASAGPPPAAPFSLNTSASGVFGSPADVAKPVKDGPPTHPVSEGGPGEYTKSFGEKPGQREAPKPQEAAKPAVVVPIAAKKPKMHPAAIAGVVAAVLLLLALIVFAVVLSQRSH
jgi:hypothetical protein